MIGEQLAGNKRITTVGLLFESVTELRRVFEPRIASESGLSLPAFDVLIRLARTPDYQLRMSELASQAALTPSGLTRSVDRLEESGLVSRETCPEDGRGAFAVLSERGRTVMDQAIPNHIAHIGELLDGVLTAEEERNLSSLLRKVRDHLRTVDQPIGTSDHVVAVSPTGDTSSSSN